jgi:SAM-dependent methyltransferase
MISWKENIVGNIKVGDQSFPVDEFGILNIKGNNTIAYEFHQTHTKGAFLRKFEKQKFHQVNWETPYYKKVFNEYLDGHDSFDKVALDLGCGDGRFTEYLLLKGYSKIVCVDFDYRLLVSLSEFAKQNGYSDKLLLICSDISNLPLKEDSFDLVLSIRTLYYLNDKYEEAIKYIYALLKKNGLFVISDPNMEGFVLRALVFDSLSNALLTFEKRRFKEVQVETDIWFRLFEEKELTAIYLKSGFKIEAKHGISMFHNFLRVAQLRGMIPESEIEKDEIRIEKMFDHLHEYGNLNKDIIWKLQKKVV